MTSSSADPIDPTRVREAVERVQINIRCQSPRLSTANCEQEHLRTLMTAALDSLTQRERADHNAELVQIHCDAAREFAAERDRQRDLVREQSKAMAGLKQANDGRGEVITELTRRLVTAATERDQLRSELEAARRERNIAEHDRGELSQKVTDLQRELEAARAERDRLGSLLRSEIEERKRLEAALARAHE